MNTLSSLKFDLGITTTAYDERLEEYLTSAAAFIRREGVNTLDLENAEDAHLVVMYAAWLWRRRESGEGMPRMVRWALNNRIFAEHMQEGS